MRSPESLGALMSMLLIAPGMVAGDDAPGRVLVRQEEDAASMVRGAYHLWLAADLLEKELDLVSESALALVEHLDEEVSLLPGVDTMDQQMALLQMKLLQGVDFHPPAEGADLRGWHRIDATDLGEFCKERPTTTVVLSRVPREFEAQVLESRGGFGGKIAEINPGFSIELHPAWLLVLEVDETFFFGDYAIAPYVIVPFAAFVHEGRVYCPVYTINDYFPEVGQRLIVLPSTGPMDEDGRFMLVTSPDELFLVEEPDGTGVERVVPVGNARRTVPSNLVDFRRSVATWRAKRDDLRSRR